MSEATGMEAKTIHRLLEYNPKDGFLRATLARLVSNACTAREPCLQYSRELQAILVGFAGNSRGLCKQNLTALLVKLGDIACHTRRDCLLRLLTTNVTPLK